MSDASALVTMTAHASNVTVLERGGTRESFRLAMTDERTIIRLSVAATEPVIASQRNRHAAPVTTRFGVSSSKPVFPAHDGGDNHARFDNPATAPV